MTERLPPLPDLPPHDTDRSDAQATRAQPPISQTPPAQPRVPATLRPPLPLGHVQRGARPMPAMPPPTSASVRRVAPRRRTNTVILPWWSLVAMLLLVMVVVFGIVGAFVALSQRPTPQPVTPIIRIITAQPPTSALVQAPPLGAPAIQLPGLGGTPGQQMALSGPTLPAVVFTPTPVPITVGRSVVVRGVQDQQLNVRDRAGIRGSTILFRAVEGTRFTVISGPQQADNFIWWQIQDATNPANSGWAVANYLEVVPTGG